MRTMKNSRLTAAVAVAIVSGGWLTTPAVAASPPEARWSVRAYALRVFPNDMALRTGDQVLTVADGNGLGLELEYLLNARIGFEATAVIADLEGGLLLDTGGMTLRDRGEIAFESFTLGANYHLTPDSWVDVSVGAFGGLSYFDDVIFFAGSVQQEKRVWDDDLGFGLKLAAAVPLRRGGPWRLVAGVRYLQTLMEGEVAGQDLDADPLIAYVGIGYSF